jgi:DNA-binding NarL/FixJ family response regulator
MARTALIVDDHRLFRASARMLLESEGFKVVGEAADGAEAMAEAHRVRPDVVLLDVQLPDTTGFDVVRRLLDADLGCQVVLVSSRHASEYGELVHLSGVLGFIAKDELSGPVLQRVLEKAGTHEAEHVE